MKKFGYDIIRLNDVLLEHTDCHMVKPKMVYISNATEIGTVYTKEEIKELYEYCREKNLYLYMDGARLASAMAASDVTYEDLGNYTDIFYIGGTKNGGYMGEAVVINRVELAKDFDYCIKHFGAMLAKGFVAAIPFEVLMKDDLYYSIGKKENNCAKILQDGLEKIGVCFMIKSLTNQIFPIFRKEEIKKLEKECSFEVWKEWNRDWVVIRLVTSFSTTEEECERFLKVVEKIYQN